MRKLGIFEPLFRPKEFFSKYLKVIEFEIRKNEFLKHFCASPLENLVLDVFWAEPVG